MRILRLVLALFVVALAAWWLFSYQKKAFKGDGTISDSGLFSSPRFHIRLGSIPLSEAGEYRFTVSGLPPERLDLQLYVPDKNERDRSTLVQLSTELEAIIRDGSGGSVCSVSGRLSDATGRNGAGWVLKTSNSTAAFWQSKCLNLPINRRDSYTVELRVSNVDPRSPQVSLIPTLEGGGIELP